MRTGANPEALVLGTVVVVVLFFLVLAIREVSRWLKKRGGK